MKTIALIPARSGSKRLPGKNTKPLLGKPLIAYTIEAALGCSLVEAVYVSTDDPVIADIAESYGASPMPLRPAELATDEATSDDVVRHFLDWFKSEDGEWPEALILLQPTSPLRTSDDIEGAVRLYQSIEQPGCVVSVSPGKPFNWQGGIDSQGQFVRHPVIHSGLEGHFILNGALYCGDPTEVYETGFLHSALYPYVMSPHASVDIDTLDDFEMAAFFLSRSQAAHPEDTRQVVRP